jgi:hypothetical protein
MIDPEIPSVIGLVDWTALAVGVAVILTIFALWWFRERITENI